METYNLLIVDDEKHTREDLRDYFGSQEQFKVLKTTNSSLDALECIKGGNVDVIITDIVLAEQDGFCLMEEIKDLKLEKTPKILVVTALMQEGFVQKAMGLGANYFMAKPFDCELVCKRLKEVMAQTNMVAQIRPYSRTVSRAMEEKITNIFITVGIPAHIKGYQFLREAIKMAIDCPDIINCITKKLYPNIADRFDTTASKVERAIRHAIEVAWNRGKIENINTLFGVKVYTNNEKPTNGEFIALIADKMLIEGA